MRAKDCYKYTILIEAQLQTEAYLPKETARESLIKWLNGEEKLDFYYSNSHVTGAVLKEAHLGKALGPKARVFNGDSPYNETSIKGKHGRTGST